MHWKQRFSTHKTATKKNSGNINASEIERCDLEGFSLCDSSFSCGESVDVAVCTVDLWNHKVQRVERTKPGLVGVLFLPQQRHGSREMIGFAGGLL